MLIAETGHAPSHCLSRGPFACCPSSLRVRLPRWHLQRGELGRNRKGIRQLFHPKSALWHRKRGGLRCLRYCAVVRANTGRWELFAGHWPPFNRRGRHSWACSRVVEICLLQGEFVAVSIFSFLCTDNCRNADKLRYKRNRSAQKLLYVQSWNVYSKLKVFGIWSSSQRFSNANLTEMHAVRCLTLQNMTSNLSLLGCARPTRK